MIYTDGQYLEDMHAWYCDWLIPIRAVAKRDNCMGGGGVYSDIHVHIP